MTKWRSNNSSPKRTRNRSSKTKTKDDEETESSEDSSEESEHSRSDADNISGSDESDTERSDPDEDTRPKNKISLKKIPLNKKQTPVNKTSSNEDEENIKSIVTLGYDSPTQINPEEIANHLQWTLQSMTSDDFAQKGLNEAGIKFGFLAYLRAIVGSKVPFKDVSEQLATKPARRQGYMDLLLSLDDGKLIIELKYLKLCYWKGSPKKSFKATEVKQARNWFTQESNRFKKGNLLQQKFWNDNKEKTVQEVQDDAAEQVKGYTPSLPITQQPKTIRRWVFVAAVNRVVFYDVDTQYQYIPEAASIDHKTQ